MANTIDFNVSTNAVNVLNQTGAAAEKTAKGFTSAKAELRALNQQLLTMDQTSDAFKKASARAAELKDNISDLGAEINANAGNAFEGLSNNVGLFGSRLMDLDLKGAGQALTGMGVAVSKIDFKTVKEEVGGLIKGLKDLGVAVLKNPWFLAGAALAAIVVYWKDISDLISNKSGMIKSLQQQADLLSRQTKILEKNVTLLKSTKASAGEIYQAELNVLDAKDKQLTAAYKLSLLEGEQAAINESRAALDDTRAEKQAKLNATIAEGHSMAQDIVAEGDKDVALQQARIKASQQYIDKAQQIEINIKEQKKQQEKLNVELQKAAKHAVVERDNIDETAKFARRELERAQEKVDAQEKLIKQSEKDLKIIKEKGIEVWNNTKTAEEQAKIDEAAAIRKAQREAEAKKLADELLAIKKELADWDRRNLSDLDKELFLLNERQKLEVASYQKAKQSAEETSALLEFHKQEEQAIRDKYAKIEYDKQVALDKLLADEFRQKYNSISAIAAEQEKENELRLLSEKDKEIQINKEKYDALIAEANLRGIDTKVFLDAQLAEEDAIKKKWADKEADDDKKLKISKAELAIKMAEESFTALSALGDAYFSSQLANVQAGSKAELDLKKKQFAFNKKMQIGGAIIDTAKAITAAIAANPFPSPTLPISIALASITGAAQIAKIASTKFDGGGGGSGGVNIPTTGGDGTTAPSPANYDFISQQPNQQPPLQAYVVGSQVSSNLEAQQLIQNQSRLGG
jgi:hypothetical protein